MWQHRLVKGIKQLAGVLVDLQSSAYFFKPERNSELPSARAALELQ